MADTVIGSLIYKITGDSAALDSSLDMSRQKIDRIGDSLTRLGQRARTIGGTVFSGIFIKSLLESSSRVEELGNKFDTVFSGIERESDAWARKYAADTRRGVTATKEFLAAQQDIRTGYGDSAEKAALFSRAVVGVTNDLASFSNVPVDEAMAAVNSGLSQQFEALRRLGIGLNVQIINQGAYAKSLGKTWDEMNNLERQEAILSEIMSQSRNATHQSIQTWQEYDYTIGDAARTSDSFANSSQGLAQSLDDMKAELGDALMPLATELVGIALDGVQKFNSWSDGAQRLTVSLLAFGAAMVSIGGPVGAVIGAIGALAVILSSHKSAADDLAASVDGLRRSADEYNSVVAKLSGNTDDLTASERALYEVQLKRLKLDMDKKMEKTASSYKKAREQATALTKEEAQAQARLDTTRRLMEALEQGSTEGLQNAFNHLDRMAMSGQALADYDAQMWVTLGDLLPRVQNALMGQGETVDDLLEELGDDYEFFHKKSVQSSQEAVETNLSNEESILELAVAYSKGMLDLEGYMELYPEFTALIMQTAESLRGETEALGAQGDAMQTAAALGNEWRDKRQEQLAAIYDRLAEYQKAADVRKGILEEERKAELDALAVSAGIIKEGEQLTREKLKSALESNEGFAAEYYALNQYYTSEIAAVQKDASDKIEAETDRQRKAEQELADERKRNADEWKEKLRQQAIAAQQEAAAELEAEGDIEEAYAIRLRLINEEEARELEALQAKVDANKATEQDIMNLRAYYAEERDALQTKQEQAVEKAADEAARKAKKRFDDQMKELKSFASEAVSLSKGLASAIVSLHGAATDGAIAEIDRQTKARLEAMGLAEKTEKDRLQEEYDAAVKSGDMKLAKEKSEAIARLAIEQEADEEKKRLQRKQAERERNMRIFETTIAMLSSIVKYLADPGSWAGVGLSAMAAITGAVQIAAIKAAPLPSFDVGVNYVPEDMLAMIHKGETILPAPMAESVRRGDAVLGEGGAKVYVNIQNHSQENVDVSRGSDERELVITIGKVVDGQISSGRYDASLGYRYGLRRRGRDA